MPYQRFYFFVILKAMSPFSVTIRLLDPPLHEFLPQKDDQNKIEEIAEDLNVSDYEIKSRIAQLHEFNPMLGHRGCRLGVTMPEVTRMQVRAILEAAAKLTQEGVEVHPEIMVPLVGNAKELEHQRNNIVEVAENVKAETGMTGLDYKIGTMIEVPRAAVTADEIAEYAEFFSFGTNDLTQMSCGFSRDDAGSFLPQYVDMGIYDDDPFKSIDQKGVGELVRIAIEKGRGARSNIHLGVCGEHGGDPASIHFFHKLGLDYVSCSPFRVPIALIAAAHAALED